MYCCESCLQIEICPVRTHPDIASLGALGDKSTTSVTRTGEKGLVGRVQAMLFNYRAEAKALFAQTGEERHNSRQYAHKILANSMYGMLGEPS